jgi:hypothetical protein
MEQAASREVLRAMARPVVDVLILETPLGVAFAGPVRAFRTWLAGLPREGKLTDALGSGQLASIGDTASNGSVSPRSQPEE